MSGPTSCKDEKSYPCPRNGEEGLGPEEVQWVKESMHLDLHILDSHSMLLCTKLALQGDIVLANAVSQDASSRGGMVM